MVEALSNEVCFENKAMFQRNVSCVKRVIVIIIGLRITYDVSCSLSVIMWDSCHPLDLPPVYFPNTWRSVS